MKNNLNKLTDKVKERVIKQIQPKVAEQIKTAFAELEKDWAIRERYIKEQTKKEILDKIEKFQKELLEIIDDCVNDWSYIERKYNEKFDELKQQLNQPKTEHEHEN